VLVASSAFAQTPTTIYIAPTENDFHVYLAAAIAKKHVPVQVSTTAENATYSLKAAAVSEKSITTGHKVVNCVFAHCGGNEDKANTSVQLVDGKGIVVWSYAVNKQRGQKNYQSMAEAIAKHLNDDFFKKH